MSEAQSSARDPAAAVLPIVLGPQSPSGASIDERPTRIQEPPSRENIALNEAARKLIGTRLEHFLLLDAVGKGGMGQVFRALDERLDRVVALKVLSLEVVDNEDRLRRFEQEAKSAGRLDSPFFARVYHYGRDQNLSFIAMEYVDGENLAIAIAKHGRLPAADALRIGIQIAYGLHHAASRGVVHRDIKPSNIQVTPEGVAKLVDMGLARDAMSAGGDLTKTNVTMGTLDYISPEQASDARNVDVRSDIYSLGCTLFHAVTGTPPFPEGSDLQKLFQHHNEPTPDAHQVAPDVPVELSQLIMHMMAKRPDDRPQTPIELIHEMQAVASALQVEVPSSVASVPPPPTPKWWQVHLAYWGPALALLLGLAGYLAWPTDRDTDPGWSRTPSIIRQQTPPPPPIVLEPSVGPVVVVRAEDDLQATIENAAPGSQLRLAGEEYVLNAKSVDRRLTGLVINKNLSIEPLLAGTRTVLRIEQAGRANNEEAWTSLVAVKNAHVSFTRLYFLPPRDRASGSIVASDAHIVLRDCIVDAAPMEMQPTPSGCIGVEIASGQLAAIDSRFFSGDVAIKSVGSGQAAVHFWNCAIGAYRKTFQLDSDKASVTLSHCAVLAGSESTFLLGKPSGTNLKADRTVFSSTRIDAMQPLIDAAGDQPVSESLWRGSGNIFAFGCEPRLVIGNQKIIAEPARLAASGFVDESKSTIEGWPWTASLEEMQGTPSQSTDWRSLFSLTDDLRQPGELLTTGINGTPEPTEAKTPTQDANQPVRPNGGLLVDPTRTMDESRGIFSSIAAAVAAAPADRETIIELASAASGLSLNGVAITDKQIVLRSKGIQRWKLADGIDNIGQPACLFTLEANGRLTLDGFDLEISGLRDAADSSVFRCAAGSSITFTGVHLKSAFGQMENRASMFHVVDRAVEGESSAARIQIDRSDIRHGGMLLTSAPGRAWSLDIDSSIIGIDGPLVRMNGTSDSSTTGSDAISVRQSTLLLRNGLVSVDAQPRSEMGARQPFRVQMELARSAFFAVGQASTTPLVSIKTKSVVRSMTNAEFATWRSDWNLFVGFRTMYQTPESDLAAMNLAATRSFTFAEWLNEFGLLANRHVHESEPYVGVRSIWDRPTPTQGTLPSQFPEIAEQFPPEERIGAPDLSK